MGQVWDLELSPAKRMVLLALADHADHEGDNIFPSYALIAWKTSYSVRQVQRIMTDLEADGILEQVKARRGKSTVFKINFAKGVQKAPFEKNKRRTSHVKMSNDKMTSDDKMSIDKMSWDDKKADSESTSHDIASAKMPPNHPLKEEPSDLKDKRSRARAKHDYDDVPQQDRLAIIKAWADELPAAPINPYTDKNHRTAADIFRAGYRAHQVTLVTKAILDDTWWRGKTLTLQKVAELMPERLLNMTSPSSNGKAKPTQQPPARVVNPHGFDGYALAKRMEAEGTNDKGVIPGITDVDEEDDYAQASTS
jgi:Helix-turn-helix domain